jgi:alpha-N-acetylglucosamine transferase
VHLSIILDMPSGISITRVTLDSLALRVYTYHKMQAVHQSDLTIERGKKCHSLDDTMMQSTRWLSTETDLSVFSITNFVDCCFVPT